MQGARALVEVMRQSGVRHIFGLPGDTSMDLYDALREVRGEISHIMTRDERSASFMADVYARCCGRVGVCEGPSGGGATYILPGVAEAQGSAIPLICLTTDTPVSQHGRGVLTELDQESLFRPITKWNTRINSSATIAETMRRAMRMATAGRPGAIALSLPSDVLEGEVPEESIFGVSEFGSAPSLRTRPDPSMIERAAAAIESARNPVIVAGGGVLTSGAGEALTTLSEALQIPVATSINGKGSVAENSNVSIGVVGGNGARSYTNAVVANSDLVIFAGTRTDSTTTHHWTVPPPGGTQAIIQIDIEPWEIGNNYPLVAPMAADIKLALIDLLAAIDRPGRIAERNRARVDALAMQRDDYWQDVARQAEQQTRPIKPQLVVAAMRKLLPDDTLIVADPGTPTPFLAAQYEVRRIGRTTIIPRAHGGLGYAIPGVVGAALARPDQRIVGMTGDGSFGMSVGELETITRLGLPIVIIHCSNGTYGWIKELQHLYHDNRYFSVDFKNVDYAAIARGFGFQSACVEEPDQVERVLAKALDDGRPWFVDIRTESAVTETPPVASWTVAEKNATIQRESMQGRSG